MNATMEADPPAWPKPLWHGEGPNKAYNQDDATGFFRLNGLRLKVAAKVHKEEQPNEGKKPDIGIGRVRRKFRDE